ncbi:hypothetical protein AFCA_013029 [Aspergillus flavus]|nr:hypothetical protein AFCA_013029 [Aspergillus flavus]
MGIKTNEDLEAGYVIVGGGTSGIVLAARLSEDDSKSVIIREAGRNLADDFRVQTPALWTTLLGSEADWQLITAPQAEIHAWSKLSATDWTWEKLSPYYKKSYTLQLPDEATREHIGLSWVDQNVNGDSGPINISFPAVLQDPLSKAWVDTFKGIGYTAGVRILTQKIPFDASDAGVTATGVKAILQGELSTIKAKKEVILTAGALNTPKLLELSGIGNKAILDQFNIPVVVENPNVDENIQDYLMSRISSEANLHQRGKSSVGQELLPGNFLSLGLELSLPFSRGSVHIASADPNVPPTIDPRYFSNPLDLDIMARNLLDVETRETSQSGPSSPVPGLWGH